MKEVVVIGAGPSGLASIRSLIKYKDKVNITAYEVSDRVGGLWVNRDPYKTTPMYDNMKMNSCKEISIFPEYPFPDDIEESFVSWKLMLEYMERFASDMDMYQYIKFRHRVVEVDPFTTENGTERWYMTVRNEETGAMTTRQFDAVMVCNGHESKKHIPVIDGMKTFPGEIMHSLHYQNPEYFRDKTVAIVGGGFSGIDILLDVHLVAAKIYLCHHNEILTAPLPENAEYVADISKIDGESIFLMSGREIRPDVIILATGYSYDFPFLSEKCRPEVKDDHVTNIYRMMVDINHPSLYYIGLSSLGINLPILCAQCDLTVAFITGTISPVSKMEMRQEYEDWYQRKVTDLGKKPKEFHNILESQYEYVDLLMEQSKTPGREWGRIKKIGDITLEFVFNHLQHFKRVKFKLVGDDGFEVTAPPEVTSEILSVKTQNA